MSIPSFRLLAQVRPEERRFFWRIFMQSPHYLTPSEQKNLLQQRGIIFSNNEVKDIQKIKEIGFYKIIEKDSAS